MVWLNYHHRHQHLQQHPPVANSVSTNEIMCFDNPCAQLSGCSRKHGYSTPVVSACTMFVRNGGHTCCHTLMCYCSSSLKYKLFGGLAVPSVFVNGEGGLSFKVMHKFGGEANRPLKDGKTGTGLYYTKLAIGSPPKDYLLEVDTGSDVSLVNCAQCSPCSPTYTAEDVIVSGKLRTHKPSKLNRR